jgi:hypothetical protein
MDLVEDSRLKGRIIGTKLNIPDTHPQRKQSLHLWGLQTDFFMQSLLQIDHKNNFKQDQAHPLEDTFGEQLGFLKGRQILDAIGTTQECLHNIKAKKSKALILKLDLKKAFDCID